MSNLALARRYRPKNFEELVEQKHVSQALSHALEQNRLHHAYLFTGTRGVGKTTIARILAKSLNCEKGISAKPCGQCETCLEIEQGKFVDLIEIDAASRTKVEDTREILDNVQYMPTKGRYKVYLIDEVHMLSNHSFNALLKTLEEPPEHVVFLLATTDPQKIPVTVLSRCLQFSLKKLPTQAIKMQLDNILQKEELCADEAGLNLIARAAKGSMRDALSLADQAIAYCQGDIRCDAVRDMLGTPPSAQIFDIIREVHAGNNQALLNISASLNETGADFEQILDELITQLQYINLEHIVPGVAQYDDLDRDQIKELAQHIPAESLQLYYQIALTGRRDLHLSPDAKLGFDMLLIRLTTFTLDQYTASTKTRQAQVTSTTKTTSPSNKPAETALTPTKKVTPAGNTEWDAIVASLAVTGLTKSLVEHTSLKSQDGNTITLLLSESQSAMYNDKQHDRLQKALSDHFGAPQKLIIEFGEVGASPAYKKAEQAIQSQQSAVDSMKNDETVKALMDQFDAKFVPEAVKPKES